MTCNQCPFDGKYGHLPTCTEYNLSDPYYDRPSPPAEPKCEHRRTVPNPASGMPDCLDCGGKEIDYQPDPPCVECGHKKASFISRYIGWLCSECEAKVAALPTFKEVLNQIRQPAESEGKCERCGHEQEDHPHGEECGIGCDCPGYRPATTEPAEDGCGCGYKRSMCICATEPADSGKIELECQDCMSDWLMVAGSDCPLCGLPLQLRTYDPPTAQFAESVEDRAYGSMAQAFV